MFEFTLQVAEQLPRTYVVDVYNHRTPSIDKDGFSYRTCGVTIIPKDDPLSTTRAEGPSASWVSYYGDYQGFRQSRKQARLQALSVCLRQMHFTRTERKVAFEAYWRRITLDRADSIVRSHGKVDEMIYSLYLKIQQTQTIDDTLRLQAQKLYQRYFEIDYPEVDITADWRKK